MKHPIQPLARDERGVACFKANKIVQYLLENGPFDMNDLARCGFSQEDEEQFVQLIGYSLSGFGELSYTSKDTYEAAERMLERDISEEAARIEYLESVLATVRKCIRDAALEVFQIHPDDLQS